MLSRIQKPFVLSSPKLFCENGSKHMSYIIKFSLSVCLSVRMSVRNRLPKYARYGDEAFTCDSMGLE